MEAANKPGLSTRFEQLGFARAIIRHEGQSLLELADRLDDEFCDAVQRLVACRGNVIVTGMGKAGLIGQKIAATLASTGTHSHSVHPAEAIHGDLGRLHPDDVVLAISFSGETEEVTRLMPSLVQRSLPVIAITGNQESTLGRAADVTIDLGPLREAGYLGLAPSTSTTAMLAVGDALALVVSRIRNFSPTDFARFHPGGSLGRKLAKVDDVMRPLDQCRVASDGQDVRDVLVQTTKPGRRTGAVMLTSDSGKLSGIFTDSDLARILESNCDTTFSIPIGNAMTCDPSSVRSGTMLTSAMQLLAERKISELPVLDDQGRPVGMIDITDVVGLLPDAAASTELKTTAEGGIPLRDARSASTSTADFPQTVPFPNQPRGS
ncbi:MAG: KpsF/GutQ family sugar-phosphate isomerase [Pirellulaceae bacterium]|jgi:arabinose-5-phosphate isomerase|nr:KpsF/GutQ family sugar-phosphate isomerase [Pirellulaceae bacterium]HJN12006.1 KpsF/GutQ family sugar-phosphate isomerase [Pirellulaceae bacterium]